MYTVSMILVATFTLLAIFIDGALTQGARPKAR